MKLALVGLLFTATSAWAQDNVLDQSKGKPAFRMTLSATGFLSPLGLYTIAKRAGADNVPASGHEIVRLLQDRGVVVGSKKDPIRMSPAIAYTMTDHLLLSLARKVVPGASGTHHELIDLLRSTGVISSDWGPAQHLCGWIVRGVDIGTLKAMALHQVGGMGQFIAATLVKDGVKSLFTRNLKHIKESVAQLGQLGFLLSTALMVGTMHLSELGLSRLPQTRLVRFASSIGVPMAVGMAAMQALATGKVDWKDIAITTGSYVAAGMIVNLPLLIAIGSGPIGRTVAGISYGVAKLAAALLVGETIEARVKQMLSQPVPWFEGRNHWGQGVVGIVDDVAKG